MQWGADFMASAEREPILGVWGLCPQWGPGAKPLVGVRERSPLKLTKNQQFKAHFAMKKFIE